MEMKKEKLFWIENIAAKTTQVEVDSDAIVPDVKPDIKKILQVDANVYTTTYDVQSDRVLLSGNVIFNVTYLPEDSAGMQSIRVTAPFTDVVAVSGVQQGMECVVTTDILSVNYKIINGRKLSVKSVVEVMLKIKNTASAEAVSSIESSEIQMNSADVTFLQRSAVNNKDIVINERILIPETEPSIKEILSVSAKVNDYSVKLINNKAILKGDTKIVCTYTDAVNGEVATANCVVPFTEILDIEGVSADDFCNAQIIANICEYNCEEGQGGEIRSVETKCVLKAEISAFRDTECTLVVDCYAMDKKLEISTTKAKLPKRISNINYNDTLKTNLTVADSEPLIERVYDVFSKAYVEKVFADNEKLHITGIVDNYVLYITKDETTPIYCLKNEIDFSQEVDCGSAGLPEGEFYAEVLNTSYILNSDNSVDLRINMKLNGIVYNFEELEVITNINKSELDLPRETASIIVYFVQENETLWDIAKAYFTTVEEIINVNELADTTLKKDMRLLIPKHKTV